MAVLSPVPDTQQHTTDPGNFTQSPDQTPTSKHFCPDQREIMSIFRDNTCTDIAAVYKMWEVIARGMLATEESMAEAPPEEA